MALNNGNNGAEISFFNIKNQNHYIYNTVEIQYIGNK